MKILKLVGTTCLLSACFSAAAFAAPSISIDVAPELPGFVELPGGQFTGVCTVNPDGTDPALLVVEVFDAEGMQVVYQSLPEETFYELLYIPAANAVSGLYSYKVTYFAEGGETAEVEANFLVAGGSTLCAMNFIDNNENGTFDAGDELGDGWEFCVTGAGDLGCQTTGGDGLVCWFDVDDGVYTVCETAQEGYESTTGGLCQNAAVDGGVRILLFGNVEVDDPPVPTLESSWGEIKGIYR